MQSYVDATGTWGDHSQVKWISCLLIVFVVSVAVAAERPPAVLQADDQLRVFLITFGPGSDPWEKFGHDAIVIQDFRTGADVAYNWGVFDFGQGFSGFMGFAWHFLQGRLWYSMRSMPTGDMLYDYQQAGRSILAQELNLTPNQKLDLQTRLMANDTEANRYYLYDYFQKNCATMTRDAIDQTVNGRVRDALVHVPTSTTYRWHDRRTTADTLWLYLFLDYALGHPVDRPLSAWQECFLPGKLAEHLLSVEVPDAQGNMVPLISGSKQLNVGMFPDRTLPPASYFSRFLAASLSFAVLMGFLGSIGRLYRLSRWAFGLITATWSLVLGAVGAIATFAWFTNHAAAKWNENWLQGNPLSLLLVVLAPMSWYFPRASRSAALAVLGLSAFGLIAKLTPWAWQSNGSIIAIMLPVHAGIAWGIIQLTSPGATTRSARLDNQMTHKLKVPA